MSTEVAVAIAAEVAKAFLLAYLANAQLAGLTPEQMDAIYQSEKAKFLAKDPSLIPDV